MKKVDTSDQAKGTLPVRMSKVLKKLASGHKIEEISLAEGCTKDSLKEALFALADRIDEEFGLGQVTLAIDGASRGNPGPAGIGAAIIDSHGRSLAELSRYIGKATNNEAEYQALILGLELAKERKHQSILIQTDSELMAKQLRGEYRIKEPRLQQHFAKAHKLLEGFKHWEIKHVPRVQNRLADRLSNIAIDKHIEG
jgi:ribonuclease HI